jgi:hypothetical protein
MVGVGKEGRLFELMSTAEIEKLFPNIVKEGYKETSKENVDYNCFAWAMGDTSRWWEPVHIKGYYWGKGVPRTLEVDSLIELYKREGGYLPCEHSDPEKGFEKIAIYADSNGTATHAARQTAEGIWTSKIGVLEDVEHNSLVALE